MKTVKKKNAKYYMKKAAVSAAGAVTAASLLVSSLVSPSEIVSTLPETPPAIVQVYEPELPEEEEDTAPEKKKTWKERLKLKLLSLPLAARCVLLLPLWGAGTALGFLLRKVLKGVLGWLLGALLPILLLLLALKLLFPDIPLKKLLCKKNRVALCVLAVLLFLTEPLMGRFFPDRDWIVFLTKTLLLGLTFAIACLQIEASRRRKKAPALQK